MHPPPLLRFAALLVALAALLAACATPSAPPPAYSAVATSSTTVRVVFDRAVSASAEDPANYRISSGALDVLRVARTGDASVLLATTPQRPGASYDLAVAGVSASTGGTISAQSTKFSGGAEGAPIVHSAIALGSTQVLVTFANPNPGMPVNMDPATALRAEFYDIEIEGGSAGDATPDLAIRDIAFTDVFRADQAAVLLTTDEQHDASYTVRVTNVTTDGGQKLIDPTLNRASFRGIPAVDTVAPTLVSAVAISNTEVLLSFSEAVLGGDDPTNFSVVGPAGALAVTATEPGNAQVLLTTQPQRDETTTYTVTASNITDRQGNATVPDPATATFAGISRRGPVDDDSVPPRIANVGSTSSTTVLVTFSEPVQSGEDSAENPQHYRISASLLDGGQLISQATLVVTDAVLRDDRTVVELTTLTQSDLEYTLEATNIKDLAGNQIAPAERGVDPSRYTFVGTPPGGEPLDSDGDGLSDGEEQRGWLVAVLQADGSEVVREVTSDPGDPDLPVDDPVNVAARDTDQDGIPDAAEKGYRTDPRDRDTDDDELTDARELNDIYSEPAVADTDGDGLPDGLEVDFFTTSPLYADTDGDQFTDDYEVTTDNRNPRVADLPEIEIEIGNVDLRLDVRFEERTSSGTTTVDSKSVSSTLERSESSRTERVESSTLEGFFEANASGCYGGGCPSGGETKGNFGFSLSAGGGFSTSDTTTTTNESARETQRAYARSLTSETEVSAESEITRIVEGAAMAAAVSITNPGNVAYTVSDIEITALTQNGRDASSLTPIATLFAASDASVSVGPLNPTRGPFRFEADNAFPQLVEQLMQNPRGIVFKVANYTLEDEYGRRFAFVQQDVNDRTAAFEIDYAGNLDREIYQIATNATFTSSGAPTGISMADALEGVLGLEFVPEERDLALDPADPDDADLIDRSYSTRIKNGVEVLHRVRGVSQELTGEEREWWVITSDGLITPVGDVPGRDFRSETVLAETDFVFKFVQDLDGDGIEKAVESTYGSVDSDADTLVDPDVPDSRDTDDDGIDDGVEPFGPFVGNGRQPWTIRFDDGRDAYQTSANPARADTDFDGLTDCQELRPTADGTVGGPDLPCSEIVVYEYDATLNGATIRLLTLDPDEVNATVYRRLRLPSPTDPADIDTDDDGLTDVEELLGYRYTNLENVTVRLEPRYDATLGAYVPATNPVDRDTDDDNLYDRLEKALRTDPTVNDGDSVRDDDGDGLVNLQETTGWLVEWVDGAGERSWVDASDPGDPDTDDDGLTDWEEYHGCRDLDRDLTCDSLERFGPTRPVYADTDADGLTDLEEVDGVTFPGDGNLRYTDVRHIDTDGDGRSDGDEIGTPWVVEVSGFGGVRVYSDPLLEDDDGDSLGDLEENQLRTHPSVADTDGDGALDDLEVARATDPLTPDHLVTVYYRTLTAGKGANSADGDCDDGANPGDFMFGFGVEVPDASGGLRREGIANNESVDVRSCDDANDSVCRNGDGLIQIASPLTLYLSSTDSYQFSLPFTEAFTVLGFVQESDDGGDTADLTYRFGGIGAPDGVWRGDELSKGSLTIAFDDPTPDGSRTCPLEVTVLIKVE